MVIMLMFDETQIIDCVFRAIIDGDYWYVLPIVSNVLLDHYLHDDCSLAIDCHLYKLC